MFFGGNMNYIIERKIDKAGRIVIPMDIRKFLSINNGDTLVLSLKNSKITIEKKN